MFQDMVKAIREAGGRSIIWGGWVRDKQLGIPSKDMDIEVYNLQPERLLEVLAPFGKANLVGQSFGVVKVRDANGEEYDFSMPRRETKNGYGYKGFLVQCDPFMSPAEASLRRDFTINAMGEDAETGELIDPHNGKQDLKDRILRATSPKFAEDPLRVLRGMQFAARFRMTMERDTELMCQQLRREFEHMDLVGRVYPEFAKLATKGDVPSMGFRVLINTGWIKCFPTLARFKADFPKEFFSNIGALDTMAAAIHQISSMTDERLTALFFAMLLQGLTEDTSALAEMGVYESIQKMVRPLLKRIDFDYTTDEGVRKLAAVMEPSTVADFLYTQLFRSKIGTQFLHTFEKARTLGVLNGKVKPILNGHHLMPFGFKGPALGAKLKEAYDAQLQGAFTTVDEGIKWATG